MDRMQMMISKNVKIERARSFAQAVGASEDPNEVWREKALIFVAIGVLTLIFDPPGSFVTVMRRRRRPVIDRGT